jgi:hypothetical protein
MKLERIGRKNVVVPENELDQDILALLLTHMKPPYAGYWDVTYDGYDGNGSVYVSWEGKDRVRQMDRFAVCKDDRGFFVTTKMPRPRRPAGRRLTPPRP